MKTRIEYYGYYKQGRVYTGFANKRVAQKFAQFFNSDFILDEGVNGFTVILN